MLKCSALVLFSKFDLSQHKMNEGVRLRGYSNLERQQEADKLQP